MDAETEENRCCERLEKCPIYQGFLKSNDVLTKAYKSTYCENGDSGKKICKRYQVAEIIGSCPSYILPNSRLSVEEIIQKAQGDK